uniref:NYN domain-containing protein n=1 Tax=Noccaea caerulescens TaxID=107243 RepID=A0A1J3J3Z6_NOCCA
MDSEKKVYAADTYVFWDIVDFKVDEDEDEIDSFHTDLEFSLLREGHNGAMIIIAYGHAERSSLLGLESLHPHIQLKRQSTKFARLNRMLLDMVSCVHINRTENFMLIMKGMAEEDAEVVRVIKELQQRDRHVILVVDDSEELCAYPSEVLSSCTVWLWKDLLHGERPIRRPLNTSEDKDDDDDDDDDDV